MNFPLKTTIRAYPYVLGLTGSIGMGKSTAGKLFAELGVPVHEADLAVHTLYEKGGRGVEAVAKLFPAAVVGGATCWSQLASVYESPPLHHVHAFTLEPGLLRGLFLPQRADLCAAMCWPAALAVCA
jgi:hypothetical protein